MCEAIDLVKNRRRAAHDSYTWKLYDLQSFALTNRSLRDFPLRYDLPVEAPKRFLLAFAGFV